MEEFFDAYSNQDSSKRKAELIDIGIDSSSVIEISLQDRDSDKHNSNIETKVDYSVSDLSTMTNHDVSNEYSNIVVEHTKFFKNIYQDTVNMLLTDTHSVSSPKTMLMQTAETVTLAYIHKLEFNHSEIFTIQGSGFSYLFIEESILSLVHGTRMVDLPFNHNIKIEAEVILNYLKIILAMTFGLFCKSVDAVPSMPDFLLPLQNHLALTCYEKELLVSMYHQLNKQLSHVCFSEGDTDDPATTNDVSEKRETAEHSRTLLKKKAKGKPLTLDSADLEETLKIYRPSTIFSTKVPDVPTKHAVLAKPNSPRKKISDVSVLKTDIAATSPKTDQTKDVLLDIPPDSSCLKTSAVSVLETDNVAATPPKTDQTKDELFDIPLDSSQLKTSDVSVLETDDVAATPPKTDQAKHELLDIPPDSSRLKTSDVSVLETDDVAATPPKTDQAKHELLDIPPDSSRLKTSDVSVLETDVAATPPKTDQTKDELLDIPLDSSRLKISDVSVLETDDVAATPPKTDQTKDELLDIPPDSSRLKTSDVSVLETDDVAATPPKTDQTKDELLDIPPDSSRLKTSDVSVLETDDVAATPPKTDQTKDELLDIPPDSSRLKTSDVSVLETDNVAATPPKTDQTKDELLDIPPDSSQLKTSDVSVLETDNVAATPPKTDQAKHELLDIPPDSSRLKTSDVSVLETNIAATPPKIDQTKDELLDIPPDSSRLKTSDVSVLETDIAATPPKIDQTKDELFDIPLDSSQLKTSDVSVLETDDVAATPPKTDQAKHELLDIPPDSSRLKTSDVSVLETDVAATPPKTDQTKDELLDIPPDSSRLKTSDVSVLETDNVAATPPKTDQTKDKLLDIPPDSSRLKTSAVSVLETDVAATPPKTDQTKDELFDIPLDSSQLKTSDVSVLETDNVAATPPKTDQAKHELLDIPPDSSRLKTSDVSVLETDDVAATPPKTDQTKDKLLDIPPDSSQLKTSDVSVLETDIAATPPKIDQTKDELLDIPLDSSRLKTSDVSVLETNIAVATPKTDHQTKDELLGIFTDSPKEDNELSRKFRNPDVLLNAAELYNANDFEGMESDLRHYSANMCEMEVHEKIIFTFSIGLALYEQGKHHHAIQEFNEAITLLQQYGIPDEQSVVHLYIGEAEFAQCHYAEAVESLKQSANFHECAHGTGRSIVQRLYALKQSSRCYKLKRLAIALRSNNCISESEEKFEQAIKCEDATDTELIGCHSGLGNLYHNNGDHPAAITEYKTAIELAKKENDQLTLCWLYGNIGNSCLSLRKKHEGIEYLKLALKCTKESEPTPSSISRALNNLGTGYQAVGHIETAEDYYDQALCQGIYGEDTNGQARAYGNIGNLCMLRKDYERAIPHYTEVFSITNDSSVMYVAYHNRGCSYYELAETMREKLCKDKIIHFQFKAYGPHAAACVKSENKMPSNKILEMYKHGLTDFEKIILNHESKFSTAMISPKSLDLFVCLFESNSKTFSRAQDCAYCLGDYHHAMLLAEQCCSRTLAELMLRRRETPLKHPLRSPLTLDQVVSIMRLQEPNVPVVMLSWTGNRLLGWILVYDGKEVTMDTFEQKPSEDLFEGKSLDTYLQYCLGQLLSGDLELHGSKSEHGNGIVESSRVEMEEEGMTEENKKEKELLNLPPIIKLFKLVAKPLERIVTSIDCSKLVHSKRKLVFITDGTTKLIPFSSLGELNDTHLFGDKYTIRFMPSLLALGIMSQTPPVVIPIPSDKTDICIVGDPTTPPFTVKKQEFMLSSLPHAKEEAEWVGHYMRAKPLLQNEPTKSVVTSRLKNAVLIHIASHGSASQGFLVLAGTTYDTQATVSTKLSKAMIQDADEVLLYASDVASLSLKAGLVVLSSCDSGRGVIKGDDIQGMTRAFLVAGAQSVMTSLWKVPDKSARFFMQFFYRYLLDGLTSSEALSKASCSIRAFDEFSSMIHWSGYQITGKDVTIQPIVSNEERKMKKLVGKECSPFPRLEIISSLRAALIEEQSSDIQVSNAH